MSVGQAEHTNIQWLLLLIVAMDLDVSISAI
jgi:hypothetical protein